MAVLLINGQETEIDSAQSAFDAYDAQLQVQLAHMTAERDALAAAKLELDAKIVELDAALVVASSDETIDAAVAARLLKAEAERLVAEKLARVKAAYPSISLEGRSQDFVDALDLRLEADAKKDPSGLGQLDGSANVGLVPAVVLDAKPARKPVVDARAKMRAENAALARKPIGETGLPSL